MDCLDISLTGPWTALPSRQCLLKAKATRTCSLRNWRKVSATIQVWQSSIRMRTRLSSISLPSIAAESKLGQGSSL